MQLGHFLVYVEDHNLKLEEQPGHKLAIPLFFITSIPYFGTLLYDYLSCCETDSTFAWFGVFYLALGGIYMIKRWLSRS